MAVMLRSLVGDGCRKVVEMPDIFHPHNIIVAGGCGFIGSNFVHYAAEFHSDSSITGPESFLRINAMVHSARLRLFAGATRSMHGPLAVCSIAEVLNSARHTCLDTYNPMYLNSFF